MSKMLALLAFLIPSTVNAQIASPLQMSHDATARVVANDINSSGSGVFLSNTLVLTCLHVVVRSAVVNGQVQAKISQALQVITPTGESIPADLISIPSDQNRAPLDYDFAFLKLRKAPSQRVSTLPLATEKDKVILGDDVFYSGYPLQTPGMLSLKGMIAGSSDANALLFIQGPVNKGNSGGALVSSSGKVIGIVSLREGGITEGLANLREQINQVGQGGNAVLIMGVNPLETTKMLIDTLDVYISVGIGYARDVRFAREYLRNHPDIAR